MIKVLKTIKSGLTDGPPPHTVPQDRVFLREMDVEYLGRDRALDSPQKKQKDAITDTDSDNTTELNQSPGERDGLEIKRF